MTDFMYPTEVIQLPSQGKLYPEDSPLRENGGKLDVKYMTAKEEDILTNTNLISNGTVIDKLMESLIIHEGVKYTDLTPGDALAVLVASRVLAYGKDYPVALKCTSCQNTSNTIVDLSQLEVPDELEGLDENGHCSFKTPGGLDVTIKPLTRGEEIKLEKDLEAISSKLGKNNSKQITARLRSYVVSINGVTDRAELVNMIENLVVRDSRFIREQFSKVNPSVETNITVTCENCGHGITGGIPFGIDFLWPDAEL